MSTLKFQIELIQEKIEFKRTNLTTTFLAGFSGEVSSIVFAFHPVPAPLDQRIL